MPIISFETVNSYVLQGLDSVLTFYNRFVIMGSNCEGVSNVITISEYTKSLLDDIESRIDPGTEDDYFAQWMDFWYGESNDGIFTPKRNKLSNPSFALKNIPINDALESTELMLCHQLEAVSRSLASPTAALTVRANYGTGIMSSLFGAEIFVMPAHTNTLPTTKAFNGSDKIRQLISKGMPDIKGGFGRNVFDFGELYLDVIKSYPKISKYVFMYHPDCQGPLDIAELTWGSEMFYEMYDDPDFVHEFMGLVTDTYKVFMNEWFKLYQPRSDLNAHWDMLMKGNILVRDDSAMNLSPEFYTEFALKYDAELLNYFGGGVMHYCGKGDHFVPILAKEKALTAINLSQPHLNDMDIIFKAAHDNGKKIIGFPPKEVPTYKQKMDSVCGTVHSNCRI